MSDTDEDISNWLRSWGAHQMHFKAAAEIDRLRAELAKANASVKNWTRIAEYQLVGLRRVTADNATKDARIAETERCRNNAENALEAANARIAELEGAIEINKVSVKNLRARAERAEARITEFEARLQRQYAILLERKSRAEKAEAELDISREAHRMVQSALLSQAAETERAEVERDALRDALERITHCQYGPNTAPLMNIARAALAPSPAAKAVCNE